MDAKSLAKSKRAHTQHHKKHHPNQKGKATTTTTTTTTTSSTKTPGNNTVQVKQQPRQSSSSLPSNWDRYEDEEDPITESQTVGQSSQQQNDVVLPKSKGADYAYLISEAKSQNSTRLSSDIFSSLDDFVSEFGQGKDSFVAVRGESLLSSIQNDSFFVDDKSKAPASYEASFLSLNLHALSEQLAKIDLPKRLFIEADLFPPEMYSEREKESENSSQDNDNTNRNKFKPSNYQEPSPLEPTTSHQNPVHDHIMNPTVHPSPNPSDNTSRFEPKTAELELDMLLDSFGDTNLKEREKEKTVSFDIDGTLDDLLNDTSTTKVEIVSSSSQPVSKSDLLDDFDSWLDTI